MKLRKLRRGKGLTQEQLASAAGVDQATISSLELGRVKKPSYDTIVRLARVLGVDPGELVKHRNRRRRTTAAASAL